MFQDSQEFYSIGEFAKLLRVHHNTIRRAIKLGHITAFRTGPGKRSSYRISKYETNRLSIMDLEKIVEDMIDKRTPKS
jgi:excisionase family DNA binding protein